MPPDGIETLARWRESGEWWAHQPQREVHRFMDIGGIRREVVREFPPVGARLIGSDPTPWVEDHREEISLRVRRVRDEKAARACGLVKEQRFASYKVHQGSYCALHALSGYSFGRSCLTAPDIAVKAAHRQIESALLADCFSLAGAVEFTHAAHGVGVKPLIGATIELDEGGEVVLIARDRVGFMNLSRLVSCCHLNEPRLFPLGSWERLALHREGLLCLTGGHGGPLTRPIIQRDYGAAREVLERLIGLYGREQVFIEIERSFYPWEVTTTPRLLELAQELRVMPVAGGAITHEQRDHFPARDMLACIESLCAIEEVVGRKPRRAPEQPEVVQLPMRDINAERYMRRPEEMAKLYEDLPWLLGNTLRVAERCEPSVLPVRTELPRICDDEAGALRELTFLGAARRHPRVSKALAKRLELELERMTRNQYAGTFLLAHDMCDWAREQQILFSGRGSVVDSAVAFCLGLSRIDAFEHRLHFDRFLPEDASKRPDIDIDFEAHRRDDVRNYLSRKYGEANVATVAAVGTFGSRGIIREVGKVMGVPEPILAFLAKRLHGSVTPERLEQAIDSKPELRDSGIPRETFYWVFKLSELLMDVPRNMRAHSSGVIVSSRPICDTVPAMPSAVDGVRIIQWDKRSAKHFFDKFDILCLRGQDVLSGSQQRIRSQNTAFQVEDVPLDDEDTYRAMRAGQLIGIPQSASPAMRQAHIRLKTANLHDASLVQAGIRPGVGGAVKINELIARRRGKPYSFPHPGIHEILKDSYGIIVFQEQVDMLLQEFGHFTSDEAEDIREKIHQRRREKWIHTVRDMVVGRIMANGYTEVVANEVFELVAVFQGYGFAQGHALAFAEVSIRSIWCQQNYPAEYFASLLDAQPAGYYGPCTIANEARTRNVKMLPPDVNLSGEKFQVEDVRSLVDPKMTFPNGGIRVALRQINGLSAEVRARIVSGAPYDSFMEFVAQVRPNRDELERLILCGAFDSLVANRRSLLWAIPAAYEYAELVASTADGLPLVHHAPPLDLSVGDLDAVEKAIHERHLLGMDVDIHLMGFERARILARGGITSAEASRARPGSKAFVVGNPIRLRFPPTASGKRVMFFDLEDETGLLNVTCFDEVYQRDGHTVICSPYITLLGEAQDRDGHIAFLAHRIFPYQPSLADHRLTTEPLPIVTADFLAR